MAHWLLCTHPALRQHRKKLEQQLAQEALAAWAQAQPRTSGGRLALALYHVHANSTPPGCTPRLQWQWGSVVAWSSTAATTGFVRGHRAPVTTNNRHCIWQGRCRAPPSRPAPPGAADGHIYIEFYHCTCTWPQLRTSRRGMELENAPRDSGPRASFEPLLSVYGASGGNSNYVKQSHWPNL
jgi:hypothetical protein